MDSARIYALTMPKWGLAMTEGRIAAWLVEEGAEVGPGVEVVDIETEKIASGLEAEKKGTLRRKIAQRDETVRVGGLIAVVADAAAPDQEIDSFVADFRSHFISQAAIEEAAGPAPQTAQVDGITLRYLKRGEGGEPALLLHGFGGDLNTWLFNHEALASERAVYALDLPGHGGSSRFPNFRGLSDFVNAVARFMDVADLDRVHLAGHSMGGAIAMKVAAAHPERVLSLALLASAGLGEDIDAEYIEGFIAASRRKDIKPVLDRLFANPSLVSRQLVDDVLKYKRLDGVVSNLLVIADRFCPAGRQVEVLRDSLARIPAPVMLIWGREDRIIPPAHSQGLPDNIATHVLPESGHMVQMESASKVNRLLESFWRRNA